MSLSWLLFIIASLGMAAALWWGLTRLRQVRAEHAAALATSEARLAAAHAAETRLTTEIQALRHELDGWRERASGQQATIASLETRLEEERRRAEEKLAVLNEARQQLTHEFQNLANRILDEKSQKFTDQNKTNLEQLLNPLREQLGDFRRKVEDVYDKESRDRMSLFHEIGNLKALNQRISEDAINLTHALKGSTKAQGNWGEVVLERVLEESGLHKGREYETQGSFTTGDGRRLRPDVVVHLPEGKDIVIDSKVSLTAYERYSSSDNEAERQAALKEHTTSLRNHVRGLSAKQYADLPGLRSLDFIFMFVPIEAAFIVAVETDRDLFREAFDQNIIVVSPSTLLASLKTVHSIWRYEYQNRNALEIAERAGALYDQFVAFEEALSDVGDKLGKAQSAYETARKRLIGGRGNLVSRTEQIKKLGAKAKKSLDSKLMAEAAEAEEQALPREATTESPELES